MNDSQVRNIWQNPTHELRHVADKKEFDLRLTIANGLRDTGKMESIREAHDRWMLDTQLPTASNRDACHILFNLCWSQYGEQRVSEYNDRNFVLPRIPTATLGDIPGLFFRAYTPLTRGEIEKKKIALIKEQAENVRDWNDLTRLLRHARGCDTLQEYVRKMYDRQHLVPTMVRAASEGTFEREYPLLCDGAQSNYWGARLSVMHDRILIRPRILEADTREEVDDILMDVQSERYAYIIQRYSDRRFILDVLPTCTTREDFESLHRPYHDDTRERVLAHKDKVLVLDALTTTGSDDAFRTLYGLAELDSTRKDVAQAHLAWIVEAYGKDLPESILTDPPPYLVRILRILMFASD